MRSLFRRLFRKERTTTPTLSHSSEWAGTMEFLYFPTDESLKNYLIPDIAGSQAERVLVVGGIHLFRGLDASVLSGRELYVNDKMSLGWLFETSQQIRERNSRAVVVTNFPRETDRPKVRYVATSWGIAKADGQVGGTVREISAPANTSLSLTLPSDDKTKLSIYFIYVHAVSYYQTVLMAQGVPTKPFLTCKVLSSAEDKGLLIDDIAKLPSLSASEQKDVLMRTSELMEQICEFKKEYRERPQYSGGILGP